MLVPLDRIKKRRDFIAARKGARIHKEAFVLQLVPQMASTPDLSNSKSAASFGYTVTRKVGNAVVRNRVRRRLREAVRLIAPQTALPGRKFVVIGKRAALDLSFERLKNDLIYCLDRIGSQRPKSRKSSLPPSKERLVDEMPGSNSGKTIEKSTDG